MLALPAALSRYGAHLYARWRAQGAGAATAGLNLLLLGLAAAVAPLERDPWRTILRGPRLARFRGPRPPRPLDFARVAIQLGHDALWSASRPGRGRAPRLFAGWRRVALRLAEVARAWARRLLARVAPAPVPGLRAPTRRLPPAARRWLTWALAALALGLAAVTISQPFALRDQALFLSAMLALALILVRLEGRLPLMLLFVISALVSGRYLWWRCAYTISPNSALEVTLGLILLAAEVYAFVVMALGYFQVCWVLERAPQPLPADRSSWPSVDVFIPTFNESPEVVKPTLYAALNLDWPADRLRVWLLDDGSREEFARLARRAGAGYLRRAEHRHAKAGNINHALSRTDGELVAIFDCDHVPSRDFLTRTVGILVRRPRVALVQAPHHFYSPDPFEKNLGLGPRIPSEGSLFHDFIQQGNDTWNATMFCGSNAVIRRAALREIGGVATETVTEDAHTSLKLARRGWSSAFLAEPLAAGLATDTLADHIGQRVRWARGMVQIFRRDNPLLGRGLSLPQRLCYLNASLHFFHGLPRLIFLLAPLPYLLAGQYVIYASAAAIFAYVLPHMIHSALTGERLQRGHRCPFMAGVYETVLSCYILWPTTVALLFPSRGKFNVTSKGAAIGHDYLDWRVAAPYLALIAANAAALLAGLGRSLTSPDPEYLPLIINLGWVGYNLLVLGAALAVAIERKKSDPFPRVRLALPITVRAGRRRPLAARLESYAQDSLRARLADPSAGAGLVPGQKLSLTIGAGGRDYHLPVRLSALSRSGELELTPAPATVRQELILNRCTFAREGMWSSLSEPQPPLGLREGFALLLRLAQRGYRDACDFLPARLDWLRRLRRWLASFAPMTANTAQP